MALQLVINSTNPRMNTTPAGTIRVARAAFFRVVHARVLASSAVAASMA